MADEIDSKSPSDQPAKLPYKKPKLTELGSIRDITKANSNRGSSDNAKGKTSSTGV